ncbi:MAG: signal peptidase I [Ectothiorhodospiraceae bacterium]|nr:signal peptidase I [Ectothiorhodospiraceae bacterium]MCH8503042.1 signal peptidase I [Ectothiorhodospiraceae bacterium]
MLDFEVLLVLATVITGLVVGVAALIRRRSAPADPDQKENWAVELSRSLFPVLLVVLLVRSFVVEPFRIPSGSMIPTLLVGDFILVNKSSYGVRLPVTNQQIFGNGEPRRGDLAVFKYPRNPRQDYIKRVIGLPGDHIAFRDKVLYVNGEAVPQVELSEYTEGREGGGRMLQETMDDLEYQILHYPGRSVRDAQYTVPEGHYFMVGDNRDRSADSRLWGFVSEDLLVGRAFLIWMSWDGENNRINWSRIGERIQ